MQAIPMVVGAGLGVVKHEGDVKNQKRQLELASQLQKYSPWTGMGGGEVLAKAPTPNLMGSVMQGGMAGASMMGGGMGGMFGGKAAADPMAGATKLGSSGGGMSPWGQMNMSQSGNDMFGGGYEKSPWMMSQGKNTLYG